MSVRSQAQATSTMSGVVTLTLTNAFLKQQQFTYTSNNRQEYFSIQSKPKKTQNKLQNTEKRQNPKRLKQQFRTTKTLKIKQKNLTSYCFFFQFQIARYFWDHNLSKPNSLYRSLDLKLKIPKKKKNDKNVRYDNFNAFYVWRMSMQVWEPAVGLVTTCNRSSHFQYFWHKKNKVESKNREGKSKLMNHILTHCGIVITRRKQQAKQHIQKHCNADK